MRRRTALCAKLYLRCRIGPVFPAVTRRCALDAYLRRMEIGPQRSRFAAECAIAFVDKVRRLRDFDADLAAEAGEAEH